MHIQVLRTFVSRDSAETERGERYHRDLRAAVPRRREDRVHERAKDSASVRFPISMSVLVDRLAARAELALVPAAS